MKTFLTILTIISLGWALQLKFQKMPILTTRILELEKETVELNESLSSSKSKNKEYQDKIDSLLNELQRINRAEKPKELPVTIVEPEKPKEDYSSHNSAILSNITRLTDEKRLEKEKLDVNVSQIEQFLEKGRTLLSEHQKIKPEFKEGKIRTSDADRQKWFEQHKERENFLKTEIGKLEGQKENLLRSYNSIAARIDLEIQQLEREIK